MSSYREKQSSIRFESTAYPSSSLGIVGPLFGEASRVPGTDFASSKGGVCGADVGVCDEEKGAEDWRIWPYGCMLPGRFCISTDGIDMGGWRARFGSVAACRIFHLSSSSSRRISALVCRRFRVEVGRITQSRFIRRHREHGSWCVVCCSTSQRIYVESAKRLW